MRLCGPARGFVAWVLLVGSVASCGLFVSFDRYDTSPLGAEAGVLYAVGGTIDGLGDAKVTLALMARRR